LTNYPALQLPRVRAQTYYKGEYDAVLLVYDVGNRDSFEAVRDLHAEIPIQRRRGHHRRKGSHGLGRRRSSLWLSGGGGGGGGGSGGVNTNAAAGDGAAVHRSSSSSVGYNGNGVFGSGETVVGLVGNKSDVDAEYGVVTSEGVLLMEEKRGVLQEADVEERSLLHPLYRASQIFMAGADGDGDGDGDDEKKLLLRLLPGSDGGRRDGVVSPLLSPRSLRSTFPGIPEGREGAVARSGGRERYSMGGVKRSIMSADQDLGGQRISMLSRRSVRSVQEGKERVLPRLPTRAPKTEAIERWIRTGSPTVEDSADAADEEEAAAIDPEELTRADTLDSEETTASKRQVSRLEGELLSRSLLLNVPFFETSAKTGENVEEAFECIVREVLREMGREVGVAEYEKCLRKHGQKNHKKGARKTAPEPAEERGEIWPTAVVSEPTQPTEPGKIAVDTAIDDVTLGVEDESPVSATSQKRRRGSMLERLRMVFAKKPAVVVGEVQG